MYQFGLKKLKNLSKPLCIDHFLASSIDSWKLLFIGTRISDFIHLVINVMNNYIPRLHQFIIHYINHRIFKKDVVRVEVILKQWERVNNLTYKNYFMKAPNKHDPLNTNILQTNHGKSWSKFGNQFRGHSCSTFAKFSLRFAKYSYPLIRKRVRINE